MQGLANDSQNALSVASDKLKQAYQVIDEFNAFTKVYMQTWLLSNTINIDSLLMIYEIYDAGTSWRNVKTVD